VTAFVYESRNEKAVSGALALVMHAMFLALLIFGVNWQKREAAPMVAELWSELPPLRAPKAEPPPPAPPKIAPEPPKPAPKAEPKPAPKVEPKPEPTPEPRAEIDLREKMEKARKAKEQALAEKKKREEQALAEKKKREQQALAEKKKHEQQALAEKKKREEQQRLEALKLQQAKEAAEKAVREQNEALKRLAQQKAAAQERAIEQYKQAIAARIKRFIIEPPSLQGNPEVEFEVIQLPSGEILGVKTRKASGQTGWDIAVERAILRAQPLPPPPDPALFKDVRELHLKFRPK
jgi:colicin import membrane protein